MHADLVPRTPVFLDAESKSNLIAFSAGMTLIRDENNAASVLRPTIGGLQPGVTQDLRV